jgi:hypothetical protein
VGTSTATPLTIKSIPNAPSAPASGSKTEGVTSVKLSWNAASTATYYIVKVNGKQLYKGPLTEYEAKGLKPATLQTVQIFAGNEGGLSTSFLSLNVTTKAQYAPTLTINTDKATAKKAESIIISGTALDNSGAPIKSQSLVITMVKPGNVKQNIAVKTDLNGAFSYKYIVPSSAVLGSYIISVGITGTAATDFKTTASGSKSFTVN